MEKTPIRIIGSLLENTDGNTEWIFFFFFEVRNNDLKILKVFYLEVIKNQSWDGGCQGPVRYFRPACLFKTLSWASLVAQWLRICLLMQGTWVRALVWEDPTCRGATRPVSHNY